MSKNWIRLTIDTTKTDDAPFTYKIQASPDIIADEIYYYLKQAVNDFGVLCGKEEQQ